MLSWETPKEQEEEVNSQVTPEKGLFAQAFDNLGSWGKAAYADTRQIGLDTEIKDTFDAINNRKYRSYEEYMALRSKLWDLVDAQSKYQEDFNENQKALDSNGSQLADFTQIGGTVHGIGTQLKDTAVGAATGALAYGLPAAAATGGVAAIPAALVGAAKGATWGNRYGAFDQAHEDARLNAIDAWKTVLKEGGTAEQAEQAYKDAYISNLPTEAMDIASSMYMGSKMLGKAINSDVAKRISKSALGSAVNKASRFDLPSRVATATALRFGSNAGKAVGAGLGILENATEEAIQEPWQDYATQRAVDIQRRQYDPTHEGIRDFSVTGEGGLLDYYTTPEGRETAWKAAKMGAVFGGVGGILTASEFTKNGTAHNDSIQNGRREAGWIEKEGLLKDEKNKERYENIKERMARVYELSEEEKANLSVEDVARMHHEWYANQYGVGGNRQEQSAVAQAEFINEITGEEGTRSGFMGETAQRYIDEFGINAGDNLLQSLNQQQEVLTEEQVQETLDQMEQTDIVEDQQVNIDNKTAINAKQSKKIFNNKTGSYVEQREQQNEQVQKKTWSKALPEKFGNWERIDEGEDYDYNAMSKYRNTKTGRVALVQQKGRGYTVQDITNQDEATKIRQKRSSKQVLNFLKSSWANRNSAFMSDGTPTEATQALPKEDGVISNKDITEDAEKNQWYNGKKIQSNQATVVHTMKDLNDYYDTHKDLMSKELYAEVSRQMARFGIGNANNMELVLDLTNKEAGGFGSKTTELDANGAIAKAVVRLYAGADLATAAHEIAHLGWLNLSDQDRDTFAKWAAQTEGRFIAQILGRSYDQNFRSYLIEALTNKGQGGSQTSQDLWSELKRHGAIQQTLDILNGTNTAEAVEERFAWEFSNWYAQGYIKGTKPRNIIERILNKACASLQGALNLLSDTNRYLNNEQTGYNGSDINDIFRRMSVTQRDNRQVQTTPVIQENNIEKTDLNTPYDMSQGFSDMSLADEIGGANLDTAEVERQNLGNNVGSTVVNQATQKTAQPKTKTGYGEQVYTGETKEQYQERIKKEKEEAQAKKKENYTPTPKYKPKERSHKVGGYEQTSPRGETFEQYEERMKKEEEIRKAEDEKFKVPTTLKGISKLLTIVKNRQEGWQRALQSLKQVDPSTLRSAKTQLGNDLWGGNEQVQNGNDLWTNEDLEREKNIENIKNTKFTNPLEQTSMSTKLPQTSSQTAKLEANPLPIGSQTSYSMPELKATPMSEETVKKLNEKPQSERTAESDKNNKQGNKSTKNKKKGLGDSNLYTKIGNTYVFPSMEEYQNWVDSLTDEEHSEYTFVPTLIAQNSEVRADCAYDCKNWQTALNRFKKDFLNDKLGLSEKKREAISGWIESMQESCENGTFEDHFTEKDDNGQPSIYSWGIDEVHDGTFYVYLLLRNRDDINDNITEQTSAKTETTPTTENTNLADNTKEQVQEKDNYTRALEYVEKKEYIDLEIMKDKLGIPTKEGIDIIKKLENNNIIESDTDIFATRYIVPEDRRNMPEYWAWTKWEDGNGRKHVGYMVRHYPTKKAFMDDLKGNGYTVYYISTKDNLDRDSEAYHKRLEKNRERSKINSYVRRERAKSEKESAQRSEEYRKQLDAELEGLTEEEKQKKLQERHENATKRFKEMIERENKKQQEKLDKFKDKVKKDENFRENTAIYVKQHSDGSVYAEAYTRNERGWIGVTPEATIENYNDYDSLYTLYPELLNEEDFIENDFEDKYTYSEDIYDGEGIAESMFENVSNADAKEAQQVLERQMEKETDKTRKAFYKHVASKIGSYVRERGYISDDEGGFIQSLISGDIDISNRPKEFIDEVDMVYKRYLQIKKNERESKKIAKQREELLQKWEEQDYNRRNDEELNQEEQTSQETKPQVNKSDANYEVAKELVIKNRGMSPTGLNMALKDKGISVGREAAEKYLVRMGEEGIVEKGDEYSFRGLVKKYKKSDTKMQEAGQNAENQTLLTPDVETKLEKLFWSLARKKQYNELSRRWDNVDYYKSLSNRRQGKDFNPEFVEGDKAYLTAIKNINDYIHNEYAKQHPEYKNIYRGVDGHWRFEFSDKDAQFLNGFEKLAGKTLDTTLEKILKHDNLYKFYSKLKGMPVHLIRNSEMQERMEDTNSEYYAMYDPETKSIYINSDMFNDGKVKESLLHEIQHAIQDIEGFANGTNDNAYNNDYDYSEGEKQANLTEERSNMSQEELEQNPRSKTLNTNEKTVMQDQRPVQKAAKSDTKMQSNKGVVYGRDGKKYPSLYQYQQDKNRRKRPRSIYQEQQEELHEDFKDMQKQDTKFQSNEQNNLGYIDKQKDIYSVTFTKSAQNVPENQKKIAFYRANKSYWNENTDSSTGNITFTRALPYAQHQKTIIYDDVNGKTVGKRKKGKIREWYEAFKDQVIKYLFNDKHFLQKAARNVGALESYMRMMVMKDQGAVAGAAIEDGIVKHNSKTGERTKSLNSIIEAIGEEKQEDFLKYCEAFRILDLADRGIEQKMDVPWANKEIAKVKRSADANLFEEQRKNFVEYNHELLWTLVDGGFITEDQYNKFLENDPNFVPLAKNMDELEGYVDGFRDSKTMINIASPLHKIGSSKLEVKNPFLEMKKRTLEYYVKASRNKAGLIFVNDIANAIAQAANGDVVAENQGMVRKLASVDRNGKPISHDNKQNVFYVWNNGQKEYYQVADREIYTALRSFDAEQMGALAKIMNQTAGRASRLVRNTATMTPDFGLRNLVRDNVEAFISSEHGFLPLVDSLWGMYQMANDTQWWREYQRMNGEHLSLNREGEQVATVEHDIKDNVKFWKTYKQLVKRDLREMGDKNRSTAARLKALLKLVSVDATGLHSLYKSNKRLNDYLETGTRVGEYRNARMGYHGLGGRLFGNNQNTIWTTDTDLARAKNSQDIAAYKSKDITLNFGQHGVLGKELNRYIPFFNASLQGIYKLGNTIDDMVHAEDSRRQQELIFKFVLMGAMGMAAALAGQGDDDYEEAPEYEHENFWIFPNGIRIPKDQLFGKLVGNTVENATRMYLHDNVDGVKLIKDIIGNFTIDKCVPAAVDLAWGTVGNYDSFKKKSVTPEYMADKLGYLQKDLSTSKLGADISEVLYKTFGVDVGAKKVDFVMQKSLSNLGNYVRNLYELTGGNQKMTRGAEPEDKGGFAEWSKELPYPMNTIVGTFATNRNTFQSVSDFYNRYKELRKLSSDESVMTKDQKKAWQAYQAAYKKDKQYRDALKKIKTDTSLTGAQKRQKADKIFKEQIRMSKKLQDWEKKHGLI